MAPGGDGGEAGDGPVAVAGEVELGEEVPGADEEVGAGGGPDEGVDLEVGLGRGRDERVRSYGELPGGAAPGLGCIVLGRGAVGREGAVELEGVVVARDEEVVRVGEAEVIVRRRGDDIGWLGELEGPARTKRERLVSGLEQVLGDEKGANLVVVGRRYDGGPITSPGSGLATAAQVVSAGLVPQPRKKGGRVYMPVCGLVKRGTRFISLRRIV